MHRPLREPLYLRVWHLIRGLLFYNTVYWRRASDGLNMPTLTAEERERQRPTRNLEIIKPRARPRAKCPDPIDSAQGGEVSEPLPLEVPESSARTPLRRETSSDESAVRTAFHSETPVMADDDNDQVYVKRRRYRRRLVSGGSAKGRAGFFARVFGRK